MKKELLQKIISDIQSVKIAVVGDFCLDAYWFIDESKSEISIETGQLTRPVKQQRYSLGGAGNVTNNLTAMGVKDVRAFGVIGPDPFGTEMVKVMQGNGINPQNLIIQEGNWSTHVYTKPYIADVEQNRIDFGNFNELSNATADRLIRLLENEIPQVDVVIINQQVLSGIHTEYFRNQLVQVIQQFPEKIFIADSRNFSEVYDGAFRKMNDREAANFIGLKKDADDVVLYSEVIEAADRLYKKFGKPVFITRGERGSVIVDETGVTDIYGLMIISKVDPVGAGDSYLAGRLLPKKSCKWVPTPILFTVRSWPKTSAMPVSGTIPKLKLSTSGRKSCKSAMPFSTTMAPFPPCAKVGSRLWFP